MALTVKSKILMTVLAVVLMFTLFILFYFPSRQERVLLENYNEEIENFANSVALGVKIALTEQNFEGVETAIDFVRDDRRLQFVSLIQSETIRDPVTDSLIVEKTVFRTFPENVEVDVNATSNDQYIYKTAPFSTPIMSGEVMLSFSTEEIVASMKQIRVTSIIVSLIVFMIGLGIGYILARNISKPVLALRDAAKKVGEGDLSQSVSSHSRDEIGELAVAFNIMVRELNIEAALEKIRNRTIAMQHSDEWNEVVQVLFEQMDHLDFNTHFYRLIYHDENSTDSNYWILNTAPDQKLLYHSFSNDISFGQLLSKSKKENIKFMSGELFPKGADNYSASIFNLLHDENRKSGGELTEPQPLVVSTAFTVYGAIETIDKAPLPASDETLLIRLAKVIDQSYTRYFDLKKSEVQARESIKRATLDRVRGEVASMRSRDDLNKITPLVWRELTTLKVPFIRCGMFIMDEENKSILCFLSTPDGKALGIFTMKIEQTELTTHIFNAWKASQVYTNHWNAEDFRAWTNRLIELGHIKNQENYQDSSKPPESLDLHFVPFKQGMLYVGNNQPLSDENIDLVKALAEVFSVAYARYEDFVKLEKAKSEVEKTLSELKSTQTQLVHSEKMASLGELTAGIAHEIQNPLNFVNNFSELSAELVDEMKQEISKKNYEDVAFIAKDLKENLEKINLHGNRASSIVKGMLEHSRDGSTQKEFININILADEYLRLAYHGLRAKEKSFNADFKTDLDESLPEIKMVSQEISRVLLNLINNAFYAVSEKAQTNPYGYQPLVTVTTRKANKSAEISIKDNGNGIPESVVDKIFQPFFTTKPTGKGTGLGLSISYDIITKGHNGTLSVVTKTETDSPSETGSEFIITLPLTDS
jgi:signal transduction histidine kinase